MVHNPGVWEKGLLMQPSLWEVDPVYGCWIWKGQFSNSGYPCYKGRLAHRVMYARLRGPLIPGRELDHLCRRPHCVRPSHLEQVFRKENDRRRTYAYRLTLKTCPNGHGYFQHGRRTPEAGMVCLVCSPLV